MWTVIIKASMTAAFIVGMSELAKRSSFLAALLMALPLTTALTVVWLYIDTSDAAHASNYALSVMLLTPPGFAFLAVLPVCVRMGLNFWLSVVIAALVTLAVYYLYVWLLQRVWGISL
ncbi:MAG TPA: DUF3147 family protein [Rhizomicrobium sp.]|nr:DUF3147 family protein [Rhizomicrobium sp.]